MCYNILSEGIEIPIVTYSKFSKKEGRDIHYLRWQGYIGGKKVQEHIGKAGVIKHEIEAAQKDIEYLQNLIENTKNELYLREEKLQRLQELVKEKNSTIKDRKLKQDPITEKVLDMPTSVEIEDAMKVKIYVTRQGTTSTATMNAFGLDWNGKHPYAIFMRELKENKLVS